MKPGYQTTEFWLSALVTLLGVLTASGVIAPNSEPAHVVGLITAALASFGYSQSRGNVKAAASDVSSVSPKA